MDLNQIELQNLRHLIGSHQMMQKKYEFYASQCQDQQAKQMFQQSAQSAQMGAQKLIEVLG